MKRFYKKLILIIIATIFLFVTLQVIQSTYAKYVTESEVHSNVTLSQWRIKVNDEDITSNSNISEKLELKLLGNSYMAADALVPGAEGYIDLKLDTTLTSLSCNYKITATQTESNNVTDFVPVAYSVDGGTISNYETKIEGSIIDGVDAKTRTIRIFFKWQDGQTGETMNDIADTKLATVETGIASCLVNITFEQANEVETENIS